jgi:formylglycine-generating enzyme required for sulfatase activity
MYRFAVLFAFAIVSGWADGGAAAAQLLPTVTVRGESFKLIRIPPGEFLMGSDREGEKPRHAVQVAAFDLAATEVTVPQFRAFTQATGYKTDAEREGSTWICRWSTDDTVSWRTRGFWSTENASWRNPGFAQSDDDPVVAVSWQDAVEFCQWLARETGQPYRLPSEAEWEYAARAGNAGDQPPDLAETGWQKVNSGGRTHAVAQKKPNAWGLYDMLGNAWEWTADVWWKDYEGAPADGGARLAGGSPMASLAAGDVRPLRGGAWCLESAEARYASRPGFGLHQRCNNSGFRIARSVPKGR